MHEMSNPIFLENIFLNMSSAETVTHHGKR